MSAPSLIGFGLVFLLVSWLVSALLALSIRYLAPRAPAVERRAAFLAAALPPLLGAVVVVTLAVESRIGVDHCDAHGHHAHLCLVHGAAWAERTWAIALLAAGGALALARGVELAFSLTRGMRLTRQLKSPLVGDAGDSDGCGVALRVVPSERPFCFVAGLLRPQIFASTAARAALGDDEWSAMLAHERGHIAHRDLLHRLGVDLLLLLAAPLAARTVRARWDSATEQLRDSDAAEQAAPETVASALVCMARASLQLRHGQLAFLPESQSGLARRITSLLDGAPRGEGEARKMARLALAGAGALVLVIIALADPLHHALETLLG